MRGLNIDKRIRDLNFDELLMPLEELRECRFCPRNCNADRSSGKLGYCNAGASFSISSICIHRGEEPAISGDKGICNIFFTNCNLQCIYCQNFQISSNKSDYSDCRMELEEVLRQIIHILDTGINLVGFVSPSHFVPHVKIIINALRQIDYDPVFVYNTNGYDRAWLVHDLEPFIDVYLPDFKYLDPAISKAYSGASDYPEIALSAIKEMFRQKGAILPSDEHGYAQSGLIIRHLVLPGHTENSIKVLRAIKAEMSSDIHISLMSQYYPTHKVADHHYLGRALSADEYYRVVDEMEKLGFSNGWIQDLVSHENYRPDFRKDNPFKGR
jgi:putative pyruvate formate lyase activating enzyme